ncbi:MAG: hypothetical protein AAGD13_04665 [Pseudomonadota bacterium]
MDIVLAAPGAFAGDMAVAVIDYVGATAARLTGFAALIPAWLALQRYTLPFLTGGPLVLVVDTLRASLYPLAWLIVAWVLIYPKSTRHFLYRREDRRWRVVLAAIYAVAIPFVFVTAIETIRTYWLQTIWIADAILVALPPVWCAFLIAFSVPGAYARHIAEERDQEIEDRRRLSDETLANEAERAFTQELRAQGDLSEAGYSDDDTDLNKWRRTVIARHEEQAEVRKDHKDASRHKVTRRIVGRMAIALLLGGTVLVLAQGLTGSVETSRWLTKYMPVILAVVLVSIFVIGNIAFGARGGTVFGRVFRIVGFVVVFSLLANLIFFPASTNILAIVYEDFLEQAIGSVTPLQDILGK